MTRKTDLEKILMNAQGIRGLKNKAIDTTIEHYLRKVKNHFGLDMSFTDYGTVRAATNWIRKYDKKFKSHIENPYTIGLRAANEDPIINQSYIVKLEKATYCFVSGYIKDGKDFATKPELSFYIFGKSCGKYFKQLKKYIVEQQNSSSMMYSITATAEDNGRSWWSCTGADLTPRPMSTLFFNNGIKDEIINHLNTWMNNEEIYTSRGLLFKTGILVYGKAGTGKSSLASAIANYLKCGLITIDPTTFHNLNISEVVDSINADNDRYVILIDEIDTIFSSRDDEGASDKQKEKTAKLLSLLDSPQSPNNVVFVATTNYVDRLDNALLRKGRFDKQIELGDIDVKSAVDMCRSFDLSESQINKIMKHVDKETGINPSHLQDMILNTIKVHD